MKKPFEFHADLFELRNSVLEALAEHGYAWLSDFGSVDLLHDVYGLEVCGIHEQEAASDIERILCGLFPAWRYHRSYYKDRGREVGWKVIISRDPEDCGRDRWWLSS